MKKTVVLALILIGFLAFLVPNVSKVSAVTLADLQIQIQQLLKILIQLQQQLLEIIKNQNQAQCSWCGNTCARKTSGMSCPDVMPPSGYTCKDVDGICTKVPSGTATKYSCVFKEGTLVSGVGSYTCQSDPNGNLSSLEECQKTCHGPMIKIISPKVGDKWYVGDTLNITWQASNLSSDDTIEIILSYSYPAKISSDIMIATTSISAGSYSWTIPTSGEIGIILSSADPNLYKIKIKDISLSGPGAEGQMDSYFTILPSIIPPSCSDSDGDGFRGVTIYKGQSYQDYCLSNNTLIEYSCGEANDLKTTQVVCPPGAPLCQEGVCTAGTFSCTDSDGGYNIYVKGEITYSEGDVVSGKSIDTCLSSELLEEHTCKAIHFGTALRVNCPVGYICQDGACVSGKK